MTTSLHTVTLEAVRREVASDALIDLALRAHEISEGIYLDALRNADEIRQGHISLDEGRECLSSLRARLEEASSE